MSSIFDRFGGGQHNDPPAPSPTAPVGADQTPPGPRADAPVESAPADAAAAADQPTPAKAPEVVPGVPLWLYDNPYGDDGISYLASLDLQAKHEADQPQTHPGTDLTPARPLQRSGGAAYYVNLMTGRGFSVAVNPEGV